MTYKLDPNKKIDIEEILKDLEHYSPRRKGWVWREKLEGGTIGPFTLFHYLPPSILTTLTHNQCLLLLQKSLLGVLKTISDV